MHAASPSGATKAMRSGALTLSVLDGVSKAVSFDAAMPNSNYEVFLQVKSNVAVALWPSAQAAGGFMLNMSVAIAATVSYLVVQN